MWCNNGHTNECWESWLLLTKDSLLLLRTQHGWGPTRLHCNFTHRRRCCWASKNFNALKTFRSASFGVFCVCAEVLVVCLCINTHCIHTRVLWISTMSRACMCVCQRQEPSNSKNVTTALIRFARSTMKLSFGKSEKIVTVCLSHTETTTDQRVDILVVLSSTTLTFHDVETKHTHSTTLSRVWKEWYYINRRLTKIVLLHVWSSHCCSQFPDFHI